MAFSAVFVSCFTPRCVFDLPTLKSTCPQLKAPSTSCSTMRCKSHSWFFARPIPENAGYLHQLDHRNRSTSRHLGTCHTNVNLLLTTAFVFSPVLGNVNCCELPSGSPTVVLVPVPFLAPSTMLNEDARSSRRDGAHPIRV